MSRECIRQEGDREGETEGWLPVARCQPDSPTTFQPCLLSRWPRCKRKHARLPCTQRLTCVEGRLME